MNINENRDNTEEQRGYKYREEVSKTRKVLLRKFKDNYMEKNSIKMFNIRNMGSGNAKEGTQQ